MVVVQVYGKLVGAGEHEADVPEPADLPPDGEGLEARVAMEEAPGHERAGSRECNHP